MATIVLFDGECDLCSGTVQFILTRDRRGLFHFASQQGAAGQKLLDRHGARAAAGVSLVVIDGNAVLLRSDAILNVLRGLGGGWRWLAAVGRIVPRPLRDRVYDSVARHRHLLGGRSDRCFVPAPEYAGRFLDR